MQTHLTDEFRKSQRLSENFEKRFWKKVNKTETCWLWTAWKSPNGYGQISRGLPSTERIGAHVASWIIHNGVVPSGINVCHKCDVRMCVNPDHLWIGTQLENQRDMVVKNRSARGEKHGMASLTREVVIKIRSLHKSGISQIDLAGMFGTSHSSVNSVVNFKTWKHISKVVEFVGDQTPTNALPVPASYCLGNE